VEFRSLPLCSRDLLLENFFAAGFPKSGQLHIQIREHKKAWGLCCLSTWIPPFKSLLKLPVKNLGPRLQQQMRAGF